MLGNGRPFLRLLLLSDNDMPRVTPRIPSVEAFGSLSESSFTPWTLEELSNRAFELEIERRAMPRVTEHTYRENSGATPLLVSPSEGNWSELFDFLADYTTYIEYDADEFVGITDDGEAKVPGVVTTMNRIKREAFRRGLVVGTQSIKIGEKENDKGKTIPVNSTDAFRVTLRRNVTKSPRWYNDLADDGVVQDLLPAVEDISSDENEETE